MLAVESVADGFVPCVAHTSKQQQQQQPLVWQHTTQHELEQTSIAPKAVTVGAQWALSHMSLGLTHQSLQL